MKTITLPRAVLFLFAFLFPVYVAAASWQQVDEALEKDQPQTAVALLGEIEREAIAAERWAEAAKAVALAIVLDATRQGGPEHAITALDARAAEIDEGVLPVLSLLQAHWMHSYYQNNRWRFARRSAMAEPAGEDFTTWDLGTILSDIDRRYQEALAALGPDERRLPLETIAPLLMSVDGDSENAAAPLRPTFFDFLANEALDFYASEEVAASHPREPFRFATDTPAFADPADFVVWSPETPHESSPVLRALRLYQDLLRFHADADDPGPRLFSDLNRIEWAAGTATAPEKETRAATIAALEAMVARAGDHPVASSARAALARRHLENGDRLEAHGIAAAGAEAHPGHPFGQECRDIVDSIERRSLEVATESTWTPAGADIHISSTNLDRVYFRAYPRDRRAGSDLALPDHRDDALRNLLRSRPFHSWDVPLEKPDDFSPQQTTSSAPAELEPGSYILVASADADFSTSDNALSLTAIEVTRLALSLGTEPDGGIEGLVVEADGGEPLSGATVRIYDREGREIDRDKARLTDEDGRFSVPVGEVEGNRLHIEATHEGHSVFASRWAGRSRGPSVEPTNLLSVFFTDRAIYRPGQTIYFKGIVMAQGETSHDDAVAARVPLTVTLHDPNGQEVGKVEAVTNDRGGFSGTFTAPTGSVMGQFHIKTATTRGGAGLRVEEYKRPRFFVDLAAPDAPAALDAEVALTGRAESYTGAMVDGARVEWRVTRTTRLPVWARWWFPPIMDAAEEIATGTAETAADGTFLISFQAIPDRSVDPETEPVFDFEITADVTDAAGETRSHNRVVRVAYTTISVNIEVPSWIAAGDDAQVKVHTQSHDGEPRAAEGELVWHRLVEPETCPRPLMRHHHHWGRHGGGAPDDPTNPQLWETGEAVHRAEAHTDADGEAVIKHALPAGLYRLIFTGRDDQGKPITTKGHIQVIDPEADTFPTMIPHFVDSPSWTVEPGDTFEFIWGSGHTSARAVVEVFHGDEVLLRQWTDPGRTQQRFRIPVKEEYRGGLSLSVVQISRNRQHVSQRGISIPWTNRQLDIEWESFRSNLEPGAAETWTAIIRGPDGEPAAAEMVATLYDASLDAFVTHSFPALASFFNRASHHAPRWNFATNPAGLGHRVGFSSPSRPTDLPVFRLPTFDPRLNPFGVIGFGGSVPRMGGRAMTGALAMDGAPAPALAAMAEENGALDAFAAAPAENDDARREKSEQEMDAAHEAIVPRANLNETAFFFPHLTSDEDGVVRITFTMPEALTTWRLLGYAHDENLRGGMIEAEAVTSKDLMVLPNPPRFLREGDTLEFTARVINQSDTPQTARARLVLRDARTDEPVGPDFGFDPDAAPVEIPAGQSHAVSWKLTVPDGAGFLIYQVTATTGTVSDGEEGWLPVIPRRVLVTESLALPIRNAGEKSFEFEKLRQSGESDTLRHQFLDVQVVSRPAWYAVMALPYLMEPTHESSDRVFAQYYANSLARHIANSDPAIARVFEQWKNTPALDSPLQKNEDIKGILLEETPWLRDGEDEAAARRRVGQLFDRNHMDDQLARALAKLGEMQRDDGLWPWFPGGPGSEHTTLNIATGFARLRHLGVDTDITPALRALPALDAALVRVHRRIIEDDRLGEANLTPLIAHHLYTRSFFMRDVAPDAPTRAAIEYFTGQAREHWTTLGARFSRAQAALALLRLGHADDAKLITRSLRENAVIHEELGMFWNDRPGWFWWQAPIETQALMIEAFREIDADDESVDLCQVWLIKQKQTQNWPTSRSTADAIFALLLGGKDLLSGTDLMTISLGGKTIEPASVEAGTGFYQHRIPAADIRPELGDITLVKPDDGVAWASVHWQYLEDIGKITPHTDTPLTIEKSLYRRVNTDAGPQLVALDDGTRVSVGDELVTRVVVRTDRAMDYIHLKDNRGSGAEPVNVLSGYRWQDQIAYYETTRDTATHFFIDRLPPGTHVFESSVRVQHAGTWQAGHAEIRCLYAPEFSSHTASTALEVGR